LWEKLLFAVILLCGNLFLQITGKIAKKAKILCHTMVDWCIYVIGLSQVHMYNCLALKTIGATLYINILILFFIILLRPMCLHTFSTLWQPCRSQISKRFLWQWNKKCIGNFRYKRDKIKRYMYLFAED